MTPIDLWRRYAAIWSLPAAARAAELDVCLADDATYCDPNGARQGPQALSEYMGGFQASVPGGRFEIASVSSHNGRMLAHWRLMGAEGAALQSGASFALVAEDGRLRDISGFFPLGAQ